MTHAAELDPYKSYDKANRHLLLELVGQWVSQGTPSFPILLKMYIDALATTAEASYCVRGGHGAIVMVADDVLLQGMTETHLQCLLNMSSE